MKSELFTSVLRRSGVMVAALTMAAIVTPAHANTNLVQNGSFESNTGIGQVDYNTTVTGWSVAPGGYTFLFDPATADTTGSPGQYGNVALWGPSSCPSGPTCSANGFGASPDGGDFIGQDADVQQVAITQTINGLVNGETYKLSFSWAGIQQSGFNGTTAEQWQVSLGAQTQLTSTWNDPDHGFSGWMAETMTFTATGPTEVLSFFAQGTPQGPPPFALLDGVSLTATPEPSSVALLLTGFGAIGGIVRRRFKK